MATPPIARRTKEPMQPDLHNNISAVAFERRLAEAP
jgi:hypothetical protein